MKRIIRVIAIDAPLTSAHPMISAPYRVVKKYIACRHSQKAASLTLALRGAANVTRRSSAKLNPRPLERWVRLVGMEIIAGSSRLLLFAFVIHSAQCAASRLLRPTALIAPYGPYCALRPSCGSMTLGRQSIAALPCAYCQPKTLSGYLLLPPDLETHQRRAERELSIAFCRNEALGNQCLGKTNHFQSRTGLIIP